MTFFFLSRGRYSFILLAMIWVLDIYLLITRHPPLALTCARGNYIFQVPFPTNYEVISANGGT